MSFLEECCTRSSNLKPIITVPKVNLAIRTASSCSRSSSGPPSPRWSTSCWLGPAAPLLRAAPFAFLRCVFCFVVFPLSLVLDWIQFCFVLLGVFDIRSLRTQLPSAHSPTWSFPWVTTETLGLVRKRWEAAADSNLFWRDTNFLLWCQNSTRYSFIKAMHWWKKQPFRQMCLMRQICVHFRAAFNVLGLASLNIWQATQCNDLCWACAGAWRPLARPQLARHEHRAGHRACCSSQRSSSQGLQFDLRISLSIKWGYVCFG